MQLGPITLPLRMTVVRLSDNSLWVHSPVKLTGEVQSELNQLGPVKCLVAPSNGHNLWLQSWVDAYPAATTYIARGIPKKLPTLRDFEFLDEVGPGAWSQDFSLFVMRGVPLFDECVFLHRPSASLIVSDLVQNHRNQPMIGIEGVLRKLILQPLGFKDLCTAPPLKWRFVIKDKLAFRDFLTTIADAQFERIIVAHGDIIEQDAHQTFMHLCSRWLVL